MRKKILKIKSEIKPKKTARVKQKTPAAKSEVLPLRLVGLDNLKVPRGARRKKKILGRGPSSGHGKTSTRGVKGQTSRTGRDFYPGFEGGQTPLIRRIPKRGFSNLRFKHRYQIVNLKDLAKIKENIFTPEVLRDAGLIKNKEMIKILGDGSLPRAVTIKAHAFSKKAKQLIEQAGGKVEFINSDKQQG